VPFLAQRMTGRFRLVKAAAAVGAVAGTVTVVVSWATGLGYGWIGALNTPGTVRNWLSISTLLGEAVGLLGHTAGLGATPDDAMTAAIKVFRLTGGLVAIVLVLLLLTRMDRYGMIGSLGLGFVAVVTLSPVVQPWYLLWGFVLIAAGVPAVKIRSAVVVASAFLAVVVMPKGGTVDVSAIIQAVLCAAAVAGSVAVFELLPGRGAGRDADAPVLGPIAPRDNTAAHTSTAGAPPRPRATPLATMPAVRPRTGPLPRVEP